MHEEIQDRRKIIDAKIGNREKRNNCVDIGKKEEKIFGMLIGNRE